VTSVPRWRGVVPAALLLGAGAAAMAPAGPEVLVPLRVGIAAAASEVYVAVVIDFGTGGPSGPIVQCVQVPAGTSTDATALAAVVDDQVAYANSGLLCAIDGYPANGVANCDASSGQNYYFWSYWHGTSGNWVYANDGPAGSTVAPGDVEGWRFQNPGPANPNAPTPGPAPSYATICPQALTTTTTAPLTTTTSSPSAGSPFGAVSASTVPAAGGSGPPATPASGGTVTPTTSRSSAGHPAATTKAAGGATTSVPGTSGAASPITTRAPPALGNSTRAANDRTDGAGRTPGRAQALGGTAGRSKSGGGAALPLVITGIVVALLGLGAFFRWRKQTDTS